MAAFNRGQEALLTGPSRAPIWPRGLIGSITHCEEYCAAAVADTKDLIAIGIDAEPWRGMPLDVQAHVATNDEYARSGLDRSDVKSLTLLFSAKESIFKALNPLTGLFFDFLSIDLRIDTMSNRFFITSSNIPEIEPYNPRLVGKFLITKNLVLTSAYILR